MASDILYVNGKDYFNMKRFEDSIGNKGIERQKRITVRKNLRFLDTMLLIIFLLIMLVAAVIFGKILYENLKIREKNKQIVKLEALLDKKTFENSEMVDDIRDTIKNDNLKVKAYLDLNMVMPTEKNIIYFDKSDSEYVRQYENIRE